MERGGAGEESLSRRYRVFGIVQGVGFRPFVSRLAAKHGIFGNVANKGPYVEILAKGRICSKSFEDCRYIVYNY